MLATLAIAILALGVYWIVLGGQSQAATAYAARIGCSCRFVAERALDQCERDLMPGMGLVMLSADEEARSVSAWLPLLSRTTARYEEGSGCVLEPWDD